MKLTFRNKFILQVLGYILIFAVLIIVVNFVNLKNYIVDSKLYDDLNMGITLFDAHYEGDWYIENDIMYKGDTAINDNFEVVDEIFESTEAYATVFMLDQNNTYITDEVNPYVRVSTNVPSSTNSTGRATGTKLGEKVKAVINSDQSYSGKADILGTSYLTYYTPLKNSDN